MSIMRMGTIMLGLAAASTVLVGCGALGGSDYRELASAICNRSNEEADPLMLEIANAKGGEPFEPANELLKIKRKQQEQLSALVAPAEDARVASTTLDGFATIIEWRAEGFSKSPTAAKKRKDEPDVLPAEVNAGFRALGLDVCVDPSNTWLGENTAE